MWDINNDVPEDINIRWQSADAGAHTVSDNGRPYFCPELLTLIGKHSTTTDKQDTNR